MFARRLVERGAGSPEGSPDYPGRSRRPNPPHGARFALLLEAGARHNPRLFRLVGHPGYGVNLAQGGERLSLFVQDIYALQQVDNPGDESQGILQLTGACERFRSNAPGNGERGQMPGRGELECLAAQRQRVLEAALPIERLGKECRVRRGQSRLRPHAALRTRERGSPPPARDLRRATRPHRRAPPSSSRSRRLRGTHVCASRASSRSARARRSARPSPRAPRASEE